MKETTSDSQLALLLKNDPARGLGAALHRYGGGVKTICAAILGPSCPEEIEEAVSDTFLTLWKELERYDPQRPLSSWLYGIARRTAVSRRRTLARQAPREGRKTHHEKIEIRADDSGRRPLRGDGSCQRRRIFPHEGRPGPPLGGRGGGGLFGLPGRP